MFNFSLKTKKRLEFTSIVFGFMWAIFSVLLLPSNLDDMKFFLGAGAGINLNQFYYAPWLLPLFQVLSKLPFQLAVIIVYCLSLIGYLYALTVFKGNKILFFISYPLLFGMFYGQVEGIFIGGFALAYIGLQRNKPLLASIGMLIALCKWSIFIIPCFALWLFYANNQQKFKIIGLGLLYFIVSLLLWENWIEIALYRVSQFPPNRTYSIQLWDITGAWILILWVPVLLSRTKDIRWVLVTSLLTLPYLHISAITNVLVFFLGGLEWWVQLGYVWSGVGENARYLFMVLPLTVYALSWRRSWSTDWLSVAISRLRQRSKPILHT